MLTDAMDFDPRITFDGHGWHSNFHLGYGHDVIFEDATNEKSCVQALQCLIAKADTEIQDLEDELAILQCQLKWAESDNQRDPYEVCCATFKRKIDSLTNSMKNLRNQRVLNEHNVDTTLKVKRPSERIYDIINTLTKQYFSAPEEQVADLSNEMNSLVNLGSLDIAADLRQKETTLESSAESRELTTDFERQYKVEQPADTVSEESCSDIARYAIKDSFEARILGKTEVKMIRKVEVDAYECTPEGKNGFTTHLQLYNNKGNSKSNDFRLEETEECMIGSKNSGSGSSSLSAKTEMIVKVEADTDDISIRHVAADSLCMMQDQERKDPIEGQQGVKENHSRNADDTEIAYGRNRKKAGLSAIIKPQGRKVQRKLFNGAKQSNPMMLKPQRKIGKRSFPSNGNNHQQPNSPTEVDVRFCPLPETMLQRKSVDITQLDVNVSEEYDLYAQDNPASKSHNELVVCLESPLSGKEKASPLHSSPGNLRNIETNSTILDIVATKESPAYDLKSLKLKLSQQPDFLSTLKVPQLKLIFKFNKVTKVSKLNKEKMIEELTKLLNAT